jgi:hypothetical protein
LHRPAIEGLPRMQPQRLKPAYQRQRNGRVLVFDASRMHWQDTANSGLKLKPLRNDDERGEFLGLVFFAPFVRSALHQHRGVATSFVLDGGLTDYHGSLGRHQVGINVLGSTHDAISYETTVLVARLEGPVWYPPRDGEPSGVHAGSLQRDFANPDPDVAPEINVTIDELAFQPTGIAGVRRQMVFDYAGTGTTRRMVQWQLRPTTVPRDRLDRAVGARRRGRGERRARVRQLLRRHRTGRDLQPALTLRRLRARLGRRPRGLA